MKTKELSKRLELNKRTIAHLNNNEMNAVNGGAMTTTLLTACDTECPSVSCLITSCCDPTATSNMTCTHECP